MTTDPSSDASGVYRPTAHAPRYPQTSANAAPVTPSSDVRGNSNTNRRNCLTDAEVALLIEDAKAEAAATIERLSAERMQLREAARIAAQAFRTLEEVAVAQLEHDKARNFIRLGDICRAALSNTAENGPVLRRGCVLCGGACTCNPPRFTGGYTGE